MTPFKPVIRAFYAFALASVVIAVGWVIWSRMQFMDGEGPERRNAARSDIRSQVSTPDLREPAETYETFLYVLQTGGCEVTRPAAIAWLDRYVLEQIALPEEPSNRVLAMIGQGGHASWDAGYRQHLFNSAFNALHYGSSTEPFIRQLESLARNDSDQTMRLYALQHLGMLRRIGHLTGPLAGQIHATVESLARQQGSEVSGTAIQLLADWDGGQTGQPLSDDVRKLALATAADHNRPVDIRVTAIHAAGAAALPLARILAMDAGQPVMLRKAAIARMGEDGGPEDIDPLAALSKESSRLAQASQPAMDAIRSRMNATKPVRLLSYQ